MARPVLLFCCHPLTGHVTPVLRIAAGLQQRGWRVAFLSSAFFRVRIEAAGLRFLPLVDDARDLDDDSLFDRAPTAKQGFPADSGLPQSVTDSRHQALFALPGEWASLQTAVATLSADGPVFVVSEAFFYGAMPLRQHRASLPSVVPRTVCLSITAPAIRSVDLPPFGHPAPFDPTPDGRVRLAALWDAWTDQVRPLSRVWQDKLREVGAPDDDVVFMGGANYVCHDAIAQVGVPSFAFPRSDMPAGFRMVGVVPPVVPSQPPPLPWWEDVVTARERGRRVVVVAQGTVETEPAELILPTLHLLGARSDVLTVAILGVCGATLTGASANRPLPANSRVADYLAYDAVLPYAALWVHNGGYGATMHGLAHGVPMVLAGDTQDKPESAKRVQWCGVGLDLQTARPAEAALRAAIDTVLDDPTYARTVRALQAEAASMDCIGNVEAMILEQLQRQEKGETRQSP